MEYDSILCRFDALVQSVIYIKVFTNQGEGVGNNLGTNMSKGSNLIPFTFKSPCITILNPRMMEHRAGIKRHIFVTNRILLDDFAILVFGLTCPAISTHILLDSAEVVIVSASSHDFSLISTICFSS